MRRLYAIMSALSLSILMLGTSVTPALAGTPTPSPSNGAVTVDLKTWAPGPTPIGHGVQPFVGSVILNTTASGRLEVLFKFNSAPNLANYDLWVWVADTAEDGTPISSTGVMYPPVKDVLNTNASGHGNALVEFDIPQGYTGATIAVILSAGANLPGPPSYCGGALLQRKWSRRI